VCNPKHSILLLSACPDLCGSSRVFFQPVGFWVSRRNFPDIVLKAVGAMLVRAELFLGAFWIDEMPSVLQTFR
jgi:hypothetical protein